MDWTTKPWANFSKDLHNQEPGLALMNLTGLNWRLVCLCKEFVFRYNTMQYLVVRTVASVKVCLSFRDNCLKGLGHAILGNFSTDRMVIELTKISK